MTKFLILIPILLLCNSASAAKFRGVEFGTTCSASIEYEKNQGSKHIDLEGNDYLYEGIYLDRIWIINYICNFPGFVASDDLLKKGTYIKRISNPQYAIDLFNHVRASLIQTEGEPHSETVGLLNIQRLSVNKDTPLGVSWTKEDLEITLIFSRPLRVQDEYAVAVHVVPKS